MAIETGSGTVVDPRASLALWLRGGRARKNLSVGDVARVTKIQPRILEKLEAGQLDGLPADVFVKGFVRSFARCVGLDESEAIDRLAACKGAPLVARALVATMAELAPQTARAVEPARLAQPAQPVAVAPVAEEVDIDITVEEIAAAPAAEPELKAKPKSRKKGGARRSKKKQDVGADAGLAAGTVEPAAEPVVVSSAEAAPVVVAESSGAVVEAVSLAEGSGPVDEAVGSWQPTMPPIAAAPSVPWRRGRFAPAAAATIPALPTLSIDDADPDSAERLQDDRKQPGEARLSFLPPILLDREDRSARQGGLTLAVIILLIAATLTLSYLMRHPSASGDGVTLDTHGLVRTIA